jgi:hypothetical protein
MKISSILAGSILVSASVLGMSLANRASAASDAPSSKVVAVCGPNGAVQIVDADKVPIGCHVSTVNAPPTGHG